MKLTDEGKKAFIEFCEYNLHRKHKIINLAIDDLELNKTSCDYKFAIKLYLAFKYCIPIDEYINPKKNKPNYEYLCEDNFIRILANKESHLHKLYTSFFFDISHHRCTYKDAWKQVYLQIQPQFKNLFKIAESTSKLFQSQLNNSDLKYEQLNLF